MHQGFTPKKLAIKSWLFSGREFDRSEGKASQKPEPIVSAMATLVGRFFFPSSEVPGKRENRPLFLRLF